MCDVITARVSFHKYDLRIILLYLNSHRHSHLMIHNNINNNIFKNICETYIPALTLGAYPDYEYIIFQLNDLHKQDWITSEHRRLTL